MESSSVLPTSPSSEALALPLEDRLTAVLSSDNFSVASYLNLALDSSGGDDDLQQRMAELALQLQLQTQSCHEDIGRIGAELQAILPRCSADIGRVGVGMEGLRLDAASLLESTVVDSEEEVSSSLETLSTLHALQANLQRSKEILTAAATWDSTLSSVAPLLAQQNLTEAVQALAQLENGERALRGMPNPEEREEAISKVRTQVSDLLQPQLKHALANMNTRLAPLQQCVALYSKLDRMDTLKKEYIKNRPAQLHKAWFDFKMSYDDESAGQFLAWLPEWFDSVLSLVAEERRQSMTIFGAALVPEVVVKVFQECFRPLLGSFQSRLENIHSSSSTRSSKGSLESICAIYESTLQFLSLTYETIVSGWLDLVESGAVPGTDGVQLYKDLSGIFLQIVSPFTAYQEKLPQLEQDYLGGQTLVVSKQIQRAATAVSATDLNSLQAGTEELQDIASFCFPLVEGAVARFELLNGGYGPASALSTIDRVLSGHAGELAMAIKTLSAAMMADEQQLASRFDETHVQCALEVLKVAGRFRRGLDALEKKAKDRLLVLLERMEAHSARENIAENALTGSSGTEFTLPDSLSAVEIDSMIAKSVCGSDAEEGLNSSHAVLKRLTTELSSNALFMEADEAARRLSSSCHTFIFDVCSSVPRLHLANMSSMTAWQESADKEGLASYGTLPQSYITQVGEHMLALVQALEPFASDKEALALANEVMYDVRDIALGPWRDFASATGCSIDDSVIKQLMEGKSLINLVLGNPPLDDEVEEEERDEATVASAKFCDAWLDVLGLSITGRLLQCIMLIPSLSAKGCEHLNADLNYLVNVFSALGIAGHPHPLLGHVAEVTLLDTEGLVQQIAGRDQGNPISAFLASTETQLAQLRGVSA